MPKLLGSIQIALTLEKSDMTIRKRKMNISKTEKLQNELLTKIPKTKSKPVNNKLSITSAKELGNKFATELQEEFGVPLTWYFVGSIKDGKYVAGKSDIDMVIIPKEKGMFGYDGVKRILDKMEEYKKYGQVWKKGRYISLIDVVIFFNLKSVNLLRTINKMPALKEINQKTLAGIDRKVVFIEDKIHLTKAKNQTKFHLPKASPNCVCGKGTDNAHWWRKPRHWIEANKHQICKQCLPYLEVLMAEENENGK